jgi:hypothetical protein
MTYGSAMDRDGATHTHHAPFGRSRALCLIQFTNKPLELA